MRTLQYQQQNELGAVPAGAIITGASNVISSIFGNSAAKTTAKAQTSIANSQVAIANSQERLAQSNQSFQLSKLEIERKSRTTKMLVIGGIAIVFAGTGVTLYLTSQRSKATK
ncbi:MAG: hypothetical protein KF763_00895 [Cyclobacteriaceae bacterium]|nr:hypothetical protein [Cyclobacteriaceae bacterium]